MIDLVKVDFGFIDSVLQKYDCDKTRVIAIMQEIQNEYKFLPKDALKYIAEKIGESEAELYGVATFYENFSMNEKGKYIIKVCNGTACHVRKSDDVQEALYAATGLTPEEHMSKDGLFTIERVSCLGACGLAPGQPLCLRPTDSSCVSCCKTTSTFSPRSSMSCFILS